MEIFSVLLALGVGNTPVTGEFPSQSPRSFDIFCDLRLNKVWVNNRDANDLRRHSAHYDVTVMSVIFKLFAEITLSGISIVIASNGPFYWHGLTLFPSMDE